MERKNNLTADTGSIMLERQSLHTDVVKQVQLQEPLKVPKSDEDEKDILMVTMPVGAVVNKSIWEFSRVTFMVIVIITLLMILLVLYVTDVPVILIPSY